MVSATAYLASSFLLACVQVLHSDLVTVCTSFSIILYVAYSLSIQYIVLCVDYYHKFIAVRFRYEIFPRSLCRTAFGSTPLAVFGML